MQTSQLTQTTRSTVIIPLFALFKAAFGQAEMGGHSSHCRQKIGKSKPYLSRLMTIIRDIEGLNCPLWWNEQTSSQMRQPEHFSTLTNNLFKLTATLYSLHT
jgi:hypothetical protein